MRILKTMAISALLLGISATSFSQEDQHRPDRGPKHDMEKLTPEQKAEQRTKRMTEELKLTGEQVSKVQELNVKHVERMEEMKAEKKAFMKEMMKQKKAQKAEMREKMKAEKAKMKAAMDEILTDEQKKLRDAKHCACCTHHD